MILYRPVGEKEYELIRESGLTCFPPRLPEQPIFYPVLNENYARQIAWEWNAKKPPHYVGYVLKFEVEDTYISRYPIQTVGASIHKELWVPAGGTGRIQPAYHREDRMHRDMQREIRH